MELFNHFKVRAASPLLYHTKGECLLVIVIVLLRHLFFTLIILYVLWR